MLTLVCHHWNADVVAGSQLLVILVMVGVADGRNQRCGGDRVDA